MGNSMCISKNWTFVLLQYIKVAGGTDIVKKTMQAFCVPTSKATALIDLHAYDGFPALAALEVPWLFCLPALEKSV